MELRFCLIGGAAPHHCHPKPARHRASEPLIEGHRCEFIEVAQRSPGTQVADARACRVKLSHCQEECRLFRSGIAYQRARPALLTCSFKEQLGQVGGRRPQAGARANVHLRKKHNLRVTSESEPLPSNLG